MKNVLSTATLITAVGLYVGFGMPQPKRAEGRERAVRSATVELNRQVFLLDAERDLTTIEDRLLLMRKRDVNQAGATIGTELRALELRLGMLKIDILTAPGQPRSDSDRARVEAAILNLDERTKALAGS